jgi:PelA/Pel-15E family pectate lyase
LTTLDDNVTQACIRVMMRVDRALEFKDQSIHEAALYALDKLMSVQYPIGAWPQRFERPPDAAKFPVVERASYPDKWEWKWPGADYRSHYTFNDNSISDVIDVMLEATRIYDNNKYLNAAEKGGQFMLRAQMPDPQPAWAQQYDPQLRPSWARQFEPPSVTGGESIGIMRTLMVLYRETGNRKYLEPIGRAIAYLKKSTVPRTNAEIFRRIPEGPVLARFYELKTNKPLYVTKGTMINAAGLGMKRPDGYELSYQPDSVITHYGVLISGRELAPLEKDFEALSKADPQSIKRARSSVVFRRGLNVATQQRSQRSAHGR